MKIEKSLIMPHALDQQVVMTFMVQELEEFMHVIQICCNIFNILHQQRYIYPLFERLSKLEKLLSKLKYVLSDFVDWKKYYKVLKEEKEEQKLILKDIIEFLKKENKEEQ